MDESSPSRASNRVCINGRSSPFFKLQRGSLQGCPLSPFLLRMAMEALANLVSSNTRRAGITRVSRNQNILVFVDNILICIENPKVDFAIFLSILSVFSKLSGLESFLTHRIQQVTLDGFRSNRTQLICGVPQG